MTSPYEYGYPSPYGSAPTWQMTTTTGAPSYRRMELTCPSCGLTYTVLGNDRDALEADAVGWLADHRKRCTIPGSGHG